MKTSKLAAVACASLSCVASGAVTTFDFEGSSVPSAFALTGYGGAYSQSVTSTNSYQGSKSLNLSLTDTGASQWATTMNVLPAAVQHVSFAIYDQYACAWHRGNGPIDSHRFGGLWHCQCRKGGDEFPIDRQSFNYDNSRAIPFAAWRPLCPWPAYQAQAVIEIKQQTNPRKKTSGKPQPRYPMKLKDLHCKHSNQHPRPAAGNHICS